MTCRHRARISAVWILGFAPIAAADDGLITIRPGDRPVIVSAPHGGTEPIPDTPVRLGVGVERFVTVRDGGTDVLADKLAAAITAELGGRPFLVVARYSRKYVDANRPAAGAYESPNGRAVYDRYHAALKDAREAILAKWTGGLLLDLHAQGARADTIFRGTNNGKTVTLLRERHGPSAHIGPRSFLGLMAAKGYTVFPTVGSTEREHPSFSGGYIVQTHGSQNIGGVDAIQLEFGSRYRSADVLDRVAADLARCVAGYVNEYVADAR